MTKKIHEVSAAYFFLLAFVYVFAALAFRNNYMDSLMIFLMRLLDIPLALISLVYGVSGLQLQINEGREGDEEEGSSWNIIIFAVGVVLFSLVVFVNFAFPSKL